MHCLKTPILVIAIGTGGCGLLGDDLSRGAPDGAAASGGDGGTGATAGPGGATAGGGAPGGAGGTGGTGLIDVPAEDWTDSFEGVFYFDDENDPGKNSTTAMIGGMTPIGQPFIAHEPGVHHSFVRLDADSYFVAENPTVFTPFDDLGSQVPFSFGGWFRADAPPTGPEEIALSRKGTQGTEYKLSRAANGDVNCTFGGDKALADSDWFGTGWVHIVCVRTPDPNGSAAVFINGELDLSPGPSPPGQPDNVNDPTEISGPENGFVGDADEVFFMQNVPGTPIIQRIVQCGIDGQRCTCDGPDYVTCGGLEDCSLMVLACNTGAP